MIQILVYLVRQIFSIINSKVMKVSLFLFFLVLTVSCKSYFNNSSDTYKKTDTLVNLWHHKDSFLDSIYGISLEKWYNEKPKKINREIIVATLDGQIDLNHEDLQGQLWINEDEIPNNGIDDDNNGYVDDINGWNFIGIGDGDTQAFSNFEYVRFINKYREEFENSDSIKNQNNSLYQEYQKALKVYERTNKYYRNYLKIEGMLISAYYPAKDTLKHYFPKEDYTAKQLDSLYQLHKIDDKTFRDRIKENDTCRSFPDLIFYMKTIKEFRYTIELMENSSRHKDSIVNKLLNFEYNDRARIKNGSLEKGYGNNKLDSNLRLKKHNTEVSSIIAANRDNNKGVKGFHNNIKLMTLNISPFGDEFDKDIANAIYYAVDNGAKVINMSSGKEFSLEHERVARALIYANKKNVLIVHSAGNSSTDIDKELYYPIDCSKTKNVEIVDNFINVGSISKRIDSTIISDYSNYGRKNVDLFAPGEEIYLAIPDNQYEFDSGTSFATPMVSGTAALIWLYYPNLTVQEVKNIILESGVTIDKMVVKPGTKNEMVHFSELCKTGKVLNTYNAMKMAAEMSKKK